MKKFTIEVEMQERWVPYFMSMLARMEYLGSVGSSGNTGIYADGDGDFAPKFKANIDWETKSPIGGDGNNRLWDAG